MFIIDRFLEDWAVIEYNDKTFNFPRHLLPSQAKEGNVILIEVSVDVKETNFLKEKVNSKMDELFED